MTAILPYDLTTQFGTATIRLCRSRQFDISLQLIAIAVKLFKVQVPTAKQFYEDSQMFSNSRVVSLHAK
jgi:hypothetical protein